MDGVGAKIGRSPPGAHPEKIFDLQKKGKYKKVWCPSLGTGNVDELKSYYFKTPFYYTGCRVAFLSTFVETKHRRS